MNTFKQTTIIGFILLMLSAIFPVDGYAYKLELQDSSSIRIEGVGHQYNNTPSFIFDNDTLSSIKIDEIVVSKNDGKAHPLIICCGNDTLKKLKAAKEFTIKELVNEFILSSNQNYVIKHGDNEWKLTFEKTTHPSKPAPQKGNEPTSVEKAESSFSWLTALLSLLLGVILGVGGMIIILRRFLGKEKTGKKDGKSGADDSPSPSKGQIEKELLDSLIEGEQSAEEKKKLIKSNLEGYDNLCDALDLTTGSESEYCIHKIKELREKNNQLSQENVLLKQQQEESTFPQDQEPAATKPPKADSLLLLQKIKKKDSKELNELVEKAQKECHSDSPFEILKKMVDILPSKLRQSSVAPQREEQLKITEEQLRYHDNRRILKLVVVDRLEDAGFDKFNRNNLVELDDKLRELANKINAFDSMQADETQRTPDNEIVSRFIQEGKLSDEDKKILLSRLIEKMNDSIEPEETKLDVNLPIEDFMRLVIEKLQTPNSYEEAQAMERKNNLAIVNQLLECELESFDSNALKGARDQAFLKILKEKFNISSASSLDDIVGKWKQNNSQAQKVAGLIDKYKVETVDEVPEAVKKQELENIKKPIANKLQEILPNQPLDSLHKLVNQLLDKAESYMEDYEDVTDKLEESLASRDSGFVSNNQKANELLSLLINSVKDKESALTKTIKDKDNTIEDLDTKIKGNITQISNLESEKKTLMSPSAQLISALHEKAATVRDAIKTILIPCSDADEAQCIDIEDRLFNSLKQFLEQVRSFNVDENTTPFETRKQVQQLLVDGITQENSSINTICRYFAYSRLPFMTDTSREYGITFKRRNMVELFNAIAGMYTMLGISFEIPSLFVMGIDEGDFENMTGQAYGDLDNLCQNSRNHFDNIDSNVKPANVIVDIVNVGYSIDGQNIRKPSVLTY